MIVWDGSIIAISASKLQAMLCSSELSDRYYHLNKANEYVSRLAVPYLHQKFENNTSVTVMTFRDVQITHSSPPREIHTHIQAASAASSQRTNRTARTSRARPGAPRSPASPLRSAAARLHRCARSTF